MADNHLVILDLAGKAVLTTGASTGIVAAVARGFAERARRRRRRSRTRSRPLAARHRR
jgi:NAD(P)-dependent dehydrogenase (short-subunit alcohol dehydrogenase family)